MQFAVSYVGLSKKIEAVKTAGQPVLLNASMKEVGIDLIIKSGSTRTTQLAGSAKQVQCCSSQPTIVGSFKLLSLLFTPFHESTKGDKDALKNGTSDCMNAFDRLNHVIVSVQLGATSARFAQRQGVESHAYDTA